MRVAFCIQHFPPYLGGAECQAEILSRAMADRNHQVRVITTRFDRQLPIRSSNGTVDILRLPTLSPRFLKLPINLVMGFLAGLFVARKVDVIHAHCFSPFVLGTLLAAKLCRCPVVLKVCSMDESCGMANNKGGWLWRIFRRADVLIAPTQQVADALLTAGADSEKVVVVSNAIQAPQHIRPRPLARQELGLAERTTVLFVGRLSPEKRLDRLMKIWPTIASSLDAQLVIVGEGPQRKEIERWREECHLHQSVILAGYQKDPTPYYESADIFAFPSQAETFGNVIIEALNYGLVVVTTPVGVVNDWPETAPIHRISGESEEEFLSTLTHCIERVSQGLVEDDKSQQFVSGLYSPESVCQRFARLYTRLACTEDDGIQTHSLKTR